MGSVGGEYEVASPGKQVPNLDVCGQRKAERAGNVREAPRRPDGFGR